MVSKYKILIIEPYLNNFRISCLNGELLYIGQFLFNQGHDIRIIENFPIANLPMDFPSFTNHFGTDIILVNLTKNELLIKSRINKLLDMLLAIKSTYNIKQIIAIGSLATSVSDELFAYNNAIDAIVSGTYYYDRDPSTNYKLKLLVDYYNDNTILSDSFLSKSNIHISNEAVVSLHTSRGCIHNCSFCAYNSNVAGRSNKNLKNVFLDINIINKTYGVTKFAFSDSNFATDTSECQNKAKSLIGHVDSLNQPICLSLNVSSENLSDDAISSFKRASVNSILIGLESLNNDTLANVYCKKIDTKLCKKMVENAENNGIVILVSYILFHPWLKFNDLKLEIEKIEWFGRHRIVQIMANSKLQIIPGTLIEKRLKSEGLLTKKILSRDFNFLDNKVANIYDRLKIFRDDQMPNNFDITRLAEFKKQEWQYLKSLT